VRVYRGGSIPYSGFVCLFRYILNFIFYIEGCGGGGGGVAMRARAARAPKAKSCATSCGTSSATTPRAASFTCPSFMSPKGRRVGGLASGSPRAAAYLLS